MDSEKFHELAETALESLPDKFKSMISNTVIVIEDYPDDEIVRMMGLPSKKNLLGLYQGVPHSRRLTSYGMYPVTPDKISLYQNNIEAVCRNDSEIAQKVAEVLVHEIGHHFGMSEEELHAAGF